MRKGVLCRMKILAVVGSLRGGSYNRQLALLAKAAVGARATFELLEYADVPLMNEDIEFPPPESVARVREAVKSADGVWFFTPEYNHSIPSPLKNLVDWLSRPISDTQKQVLGGKPAAISGISPGMGGTVCAQDQLVTLLSFINVRIMNMPRLVIPNAGNQLDESGNLALTTSAKYLQRQADAFLRFIEG